MSDWITNMGSPRPLAKQVVEVQIFERSGTFQAECLHNGSWKTATGVIVRDWDVLRWRPITAGDGGRTT
jgi:hypothetical protein